MSKYLKEKLSSLATEFPEIISEVRGEGLLIGIELKTPLADKIVSQCLHNGLILTKVLNNKVIRITPPLVIENEHVDEVCDILSESFSL